MNVINSQFCTLRGVRFLVFSRVFPGHCATWRRLPDARFFALPADSVQLEPATYSSMAGSPAGKPKMAANPKTPSATPSKSQTSTPLLPSTVSSKYDPGGMVTLLVGPDEEVMLAYEHYISQRSDFSKAALKKEWNEGQTRIIKLPEEHPSNVANYLDFAYGRGLVIAKIDQKSLDYKPTLDPSLIGSSYILADLYLLGERILDPGIQNAVTEEVIRIDSLRLDKGALHFPSATFVKKNLHRHYAQVPDAPLDCGHSRVAWHERVVG